VTNPPLKDKITVVTSAASGIGRELARGLPSAGARVVAVDRDGSGLEETCSSIGTERSLPLTVDLLEDGAANEIVEEALGTFGGLDILVNCAGVFPTSPALKLSVEEWDHVLGLNLRAPLLCSQAAARWMVREIKPGNIINIASTAGTVARPGIAHYAASKAALIMLTKVLAIRVGRARHPRERCRPRLRRDSGCERVAEHRGGEAGAPAEVGQDPHVPHRRAT